MWYQFSLCPQSVNVVNSMNVINSENMPICALLWLCGFSLCIHGIPPENKLQLRNLTHHHLQRGSILDKDLTMQASGSSANWKWLITAVLMLCINTWGERILENFVMTVLSCLHFLPNQAWYIKIINMRNVFLLEVSLKKDSPNVSSC